MILLLGAIYSLTGGNPVVLAFAALTLVTWYIYRKSKAIAVTGPRGLPILGNLLQLDRNRPFLTFQKWQKKYGGLFMIQLPGAQRLVVSGQEELHEMLISRGKDFAGRFTFWRMQYAFKGKGLIQHYNPDSKWRATRKVSHAHIKQYGDGLSKLEILINKIATDMFTRFTKYPDVAMDPKDIIFDAGLRTMAFLLIGQDIEKQDPLYSKIKECESIAFKSLSQTGDWKFMILDRFPWLRHFGFSAFSMVNRVKFLDHDIWLDIKERVKGKDEGSSLGSLLMYAVEKPAHSKTFADVVLTDFDAQRAALSIIIAGIGTTSMTFYALINVLATNPNIQGKIYKELITHLPDCEVRVVTLKDRPHLVYTRACILETLRYSSVAALGVMHRSIVDTKIKGVSIPKDTAIITNLWGLHHDESFWDEPYSFKPERFLTPCGELVPADHPNRKHLLPFGSGPRVCLGEGLAQTRLFLWLANFVLHLQVTPADATDPVDPDPRKHLIDGSVIRHPPYTVRFTKRTKSP